MQFFSAFAFIFMAKLISVESFGLINISNFFITILTIIITFGFDVGIIQKKDITQEELSTSFFLILFLSFIVATILFMTSNMIANFFDQPQLSEILKILSIVIIFRAVIVVQESIFRKNLNLKILAIRNVIATLISTSIALYLAFSGFEYYSLIWQQILFQLISVILIWYSSNWRPSLVIKISVIKELYLYAKIVFYTEVISIYNKEGLRVFISYFLGPVALGYYAIAHRLTSMTISILTVTFIKVTLPYFSSIQSNIEKIRDSFYKVTSLSSLIIFPVLFGLLVFSQDIFSLLFGSKWGSSISLFQIIILSSFVLTLSYFNGSVITALGKAKWRYYLSILRAFLGTILFFVGVQISLEFLMYMFVLRVLLIEPIQFYLVGKLIQIEWKKYFTNIMKPFVASLTVGIMVIIVNNSHIHFLNDTMLGLTTKLILLSTLAIVVYVILIKYFDNKNFNLLKNYIKGKK